MRKSALTTILFMAVLMALSVHAAAQPYGELFYGGNMDNRAFLESGRNTAIEDARIYDNFEIPGGHYVIEWVFGNFLIDKPVASQLYYEFRQNVGPGNGGDLIASGTEPAAMLEIGFNHWKIYADIARLSLEPGHYWFSVTPVGDGTGHYYLPTTDGDGGTGQPLGDGNTYYDSDTFGAEFDPTTVWLGKDTWDFSMGFGNNLIPEPATIAAMLGGLGVIAWRKRRRP
ncbi:MAG: PEP-CTERM sorting domain-containing protein [Fimbriimonadales bacterium]